MANVDAMAATVESLITPEGQTQLGLAEAERRLEEAKTDQELMRYNNDSMSFVVGLGCRLNPG